MQDELLHVEYLEGQLARDFGSLLGCVHHYLLDKDKITENGIKTI